MTDIPNSISRVNIDNLSLFHSVLITGSNITSSYSTFVYDYLEQDLSKLDASAKAALSNVLERLHRATSAARPALVAAFEMAEPELFRRLYRDLLTTFYSAPETADRVRQLADSAPREPSPHFQPSLLDAVINKQAGKRRL